MAAVITTDETNCMFTRGGIHGTFVCLCGILKMVCKIVAPSHHLGSVRFYEYCLQTFIL